MYNQEKILSFAGINVFIPKNFIVVWVLFGCSGGELARHGGGVIGKLTN
jgi:hypothetical protein